MRGCPGKKLAVEISSLLIETVQFSALRKDGESNQPGPRSSAPSSSPASPYGTAQLARGRSPSAARPRAGAFAGERLQQHAASGCLDHLLCCALLLCRSASGGGARQVEERVRSHPRRAVRRPGWRPVGRRAAHPISVCAATAACLDSGFHACVPCCTCVVA